VWFGDESTYADLHGAASQEIELFSVAALRTLKNLKFVGKFSGSPASKKKTFPSLENCLTWKNLNAIVTFMKLLAVYLMFDS
jgi:hypothetical protein